MEHSTPAGVVPYINHYISINMTTRWVGDTTELFHSRNYSTYAENGLIKRKRNQLSFDIGFPKQKEINYHLIFGSPNKKEAIII